MFKAFFKKQVIITRRYLVNSLAGAVIIGILFVLIYSGLEIYSANYFSKAGVESLIISYVFWILSVSAFQTVADFVIEEARDGTIQTLFLSKYSILYVITMRMLAGAVTDLVFIYAMLAFCCAITSTFFSVNYVLFTIILFISFMGFWAVGFVVGGLSLTFQKVENISQILTFAFMGIMIMPMKTTRLILLLPGMAGRYFIDTLISTGSLTDIDFSEYILFLGGSIIELIIGMLFFNKMAKVAAIKGSIGHV